MGTLKCNHCEGEFEGRPKQRFCSAACRKAYHKTNPSAYVQTYGPCPTCNEMFESRRRKTYCSLPCYLGSEQVRTRLRDHSERLRATQISACLDCGETIEQKPSGTKKYCNAACYRSYMTKRFDRHIANPEAFALVQNFDEFLTQEELPCLIEGCDWRGVQLTSHMNFRHGITKEEFKRAAGFNLGTGVISSTLFAAMSKRTSSQENILKALAALPAKRGGAVVHNYISTESRERQKKTRALLMAQDVVREYVCACGKAFTSNDYFGGTRKWCSPECRQTHYVQAKRERSVQATCAQCGSAFGAKYDQELRIKRGLAVVCSTHCRQIMNAAKRKKQPEPCT